MPDSLQVKVFRRSLDLSRSLLAVETQLYSDPPSTADQITVQALRGAASILMVASFEQFITDLMDKRLTPLATSPARVVFEDLPERMRNHSVFTTLEHATDHLPYQPSKPRIDRLPDIETAARQVLSGLINVQAFTYLGSPKANQISEMFNHIGINNVFSVARPRFEQLWGQPVADRFIQDKLDEVVDRRHRVAHRAEALSISRTDLRQSLKFLRVLATVLDSASGKHIKDIIRAGKHNRPSP